MTVGKNDAMVKRMIFMLAGLAGVCTFFYGSYIALDTVNLYLHGVTATGTYSGSKVGARSSVYGYTFKDSAEKTYETWGVFGGNEVKIIYDPANPNQNMRNTPFDWLLGLVYVIFGIGMMIFSVIALRKPSSLKP